jgi:hypothetical protein
MTFDSMKADQEAGGDAAKHLARGEVGGRNPTGCAASASDGTSKVRSLIVQEQKLIEQMIESGNFNAAWKQIKRNKGSAGVDGREIEATAAPDPRALGRDYDPPAQGNLPAKVLRRDEPTQPARFTPFPAKNILLRNSRGT